MHQMQYEGNKNIEFLRFLFKKIVQIYKIAFNVNVTLKKKGGQMVIQFCKFPEILFRKVIVIDEYYYQLK
jgi:hypothetical protein